MSKNLTSLLVWKLKSYPGSSTSLDCYRAPSTVLRIEDLKLDSLTPKNAKQHVNQRYSDLLVRHTPI